MATKGGSFDTMGWDRFQIGGGLKQRQTWQIATVAKKTGRSKPSANLFLPQGYFALYAWYPRWLKSGFVRTFVKKRGAGSKKFQLWETIPTTCPKLTNNGLCQLSHHLVGSSYRWWLRGCQQTPGYIQLSLVHCDFHFWGGSSWKCWKPGLQKLAWSNTLLAGGECEVSRCQMSRCQVSRCQVSRCQVSRCRVSRCKSLSSSEYSEAEAGQPAGSCHPGEILITLWNRLLLSSCSNLNVSVFQIASFFIYTYISIFIQFFTILTTILTLFVTM